MIPNLEELRDEYPDSPTWNDCDAAIIGTATRCGMETVFVYEYEKLVGCFLTTDCDDECAREWVDFNIVGAYIGPQTPLIFYPLETP